jgi:hypothetical protein
VAPLIHTLYLVHPLLPLEPSLMSPYGHGLAHATDWKASAAECANARRNSLSATMDAADMGMLLGDSRIWHGR